MPATRAPDSRTRSASRVARLYLTAMFVDTIGSGMWLPLGLIFFTRAQHLPLPQVGVAMTLGGLVGLALGPLTGTLVDHFGPDRLVVASNLLRAVAFALFPAVATPWQLGLLTILVSAGDRMFWTANTPLMSRLVEGRRLERTLGVQNVVRITGLAAGAAASGVFVGSVRGLHLLAWFNGASYVLAAALVLMAFGVTGRAPAPPACHPDGPAGWSAVLVDRPYLLFCGVQVLFAFCAQSLVTILPLVALTPFGGPTWLPGAAVASGTATLALIQQPTLRLAERTSRLRTLLLAGVVFAVSFVPLAWGTVPDGVALVVLVLGMSVLGAFGDALWGSTMVAAANDSAPERLRGRYSALFQTAWGLAGAIGPAVYTGLLAVGNAVLWLTLAAVALAILPSLLALAPRLPRAALRR